MKAISVLFGGRLEDEAFERLDIEGVPAGSGSFSLALAAAGRFPGVQKTVFFGVEGKAYPGLGPDVETALRPDWTQKSLLEELSRLSASFDFAYFAWADCPLLDPGLASALAERHTRYSAEYSYADGWPYGFAPELLAHETAGILAKMAGEEPVERDTLFNVIQKDINSFDIETEISPVDLRHYRLNLCADSKRNLLLISRFLGAGFSSASQAEAFIKDRPELLRTLPAFFGIQVYGGCPQACRLCPYPVYGAGQAGDFASRKDFMPKEQFTGLIDKIAGFAGDAVIDLSLWGELSLHPEKMELIDAVLSRPALSLIIETSGIGWKEDELRAIAGAAARAAPGKFYNGFRSRLSWIVSLDAHDPGRYKEVRGPGFPEAVSCAKTLLLLFPGDAYVQAVRVKGFEDDIEHFFRSWKGEEMAPGLSDAARKDGRHIIIQKYDDFAGALPKLQATDLSPVKRRPCWHLTRDMNILIDGAVPCCREDLNALKGSASLPLLGNALAEDLAVIWERGAARYLEHCRLEYNGICSLCDEYYAFNF